MYHLIGTVLTFGYLALFLFLISRMKFFRVGNISARWFQAAFVLKVMSGFLLYLIYTYYYTDRSTADIWKYYDDGMVMFSALAQDPIDFAKMLFGIGNNTAYFDKYYDQMNHWYRPYGSSIANDTHTIIRFNAFVRLFSLGHYNVHSVVANFLGLVGLTGILHFLRQMAPAKEKWFFAGVFLMPGMMFWASGVLKEPLLLFGLGLFLFAVMGVFQSGFSFGKLTLIAVSLFFLFTVKSYALIAVLPGLAAWQLCIRYPKVHPALLFSAIYIVLTFGVVMISGLSPENNPFQRLAQKQYEFYQLTEGGTYIKTSSNDTLYIGAEHFDELEFDTQRKTLTLRKQLKAVYWKQAKQVDAPTKTLMAGTQQTVLLDYGKTGSTIDIPKLDGSVLSVLKASPLAFVNAAFRPFPWEIRSPFMALSGLENLIIVLLLVMVVFLFTSKGLTSPIFYIAISFSLVILVLTGLVTPVVGAIVRYKVPALPFLVCALLSLIDTQRIEQLRLFKRVAGKK